MSMEEVELLQQKGGTRDWVGGMELFFFFFIFLPCTTYLIVIVIIERHISFSVWRETRLIFKYHHCGTNWYGWGSAISLIHPLSITGRFYLPQLPGTKSRPSRHTLTLWVCLCKSAFNTQQWTGSNGSITRHKYPVCHAAYRQTQFGDRVAVAQSSAWVQWATFWWLLEVSTHRRWHFPYSTSKRSGTCGHDRIAM